MKKIILALLTLSSFVLEAQNVFCQPCSGSGSFINGNFAGNVATNPFWKSVNNKLNCNIPIPQFGWGGIQQITSFNYEKNEDFGGGTNTPLTAAYYSAKTNLDVLCNSLYSAGTTLTPLKAQQFAVAFKIYFKERFSLGGVAMDIICMKINSFNITGGALWGIDFQVKYGTPRYTNINN